MSNLSEQHLTVGHAVVPAAEMHRYSLRWRLGEDGCAWAVLYHDGRRVTEAWRLFLTADAAADSCGSSA